MVVPVETVEGVESVATEQVVAVHPTGRFIANAEARMEGTVEQGVQVVLVGQVDPVETAAALPFSHPSPPERLCPTRAFIPLEAEVDGAGWGVKVGLGGTAVVAGVARTFAVAATEALKERSAAAGLTVKMAQQVLAVSLSWLQRM
jgi:hypothetical protein